MLYFSLRYIKIIHKISINFIILFLQQLSVLELRKFPNIKFIYIYISSTIKKTYKQLIKPPNS